VSLTLELAFQVAFGSWDVNAGSSLLVYYSRTGLLRKTCLIKRNKRDRSLIFFFFPFVYYLELVLLDLC
jgi:hypothetical protein